MKFAKTMKRTALSAALGMCFAGVVHAQSTSGSIRGTVQPGSSVTISNNSGFSRTVTADADGRYSLSSLPVGSYTVTSQEGGSKSVIVTVGSAVDASFGGNAATLETVRVTGASAPKIDVTATDTHTVITAEQLKRLPIPRSAEAIALLAPGTASGNGYYFGNSVSFGGASVAENAYYINGFFTGNPMTNVGGYTLPYGSIAQQETYTGGYSAKYGRSDGGVINGIGMSGSNDLHFGGQITFSPKGLRSNNPDRYYPNMDFSAANANPNIPVNPDTGKPYQYGYESPQLVGTIYDKGNQHERWESTYSGYVSGPLIRDTLFGFISAETDKVDTATGSPSQAAPATYERYSSTNPKLYAKLNWNINDSNLLEYTYLHEKTNERGTDYGYDFDTQAIGNVLNSITPTYLTNDLSVLKYTGYLTDSLTFDATYGRTRQAYKAINPQVSAGIDMVTASQATVNPAVGDISGVTIPNTLTAGGTNAIDRSHGLRADLQWVVGDHTLTLGVDNMKFSSDNEGIIQYVNNWRYSHTNNMGALAAYGIPSLAASNGYYVSNTFYTDASSMSLKQDAYYLEDKWQVVDNLLLTVGLRNDKFTNYNNVGKPYVDSGNQWAPRIGAAWDVFGDSSFKLFANAGRYFLALPNAVALRGASPSTFTRQYFTYTGINPNTGAPVTDQASTVLVLNGEDGKPVDPNTIAPTNLKSEYQDEYILGFEKTLGASWAFGAKVTYRDLKSAVDDICDPGTMYNKLAATQGQSVADGVDIPGCFLGNPSASNTFNLQNIDANGNPTGTYTKLTMNPSDWGWPSPMKRTYKAIDLFLEHPFDGKWEFRVDYTYSKLQGNTEGPANSDTGQGSDSHDNGVSTSENWDIAAIMKYADGYLANDHRHQIKLHGSYAFNDDWSVGVSARLMAGAPANCFGYYNPDGSIDENDNADGGPADPAGNYGAAYHTCFGKSASPGTKFLPWTHDWDLGVVYAPGYFDHKLRLGLNAFNVFNSHGITSQGWTSETAAYTVSNTYGLPYAFQSPRYVQFSAAYDW